MTSTDLIVGKQKKPSNEQRYYDVLRRIAKEYMTPRQILRDADSEPYGPDYTEYLEMSYENIQADAKWAIKGKKRPKA